MGAEQYGRFYWCIWVPKWISGSGSFMVHADEMVIEADGTLVAYRIKDGRRMPNISIAGGYWTLFFAASIFDGGPVAAEHWEPAVLSEGEEDPD